MSHFPFPVDPNQILVTDRLRLEPLRGAHAEELFGLWQDPEVFRYVPQDPPQSLTSLSERYLRLETRQSAEGDQAWLQWAVRVTEAPAYAGVIEATVIPQAPSLVAWMLGSAWWGQGFALEAMTCVLAHLARDWAVQEVLVEIDERNEASLALARRLGFVEFTRVADADYFKGETSHERHLRLSLVEAVDAGLRGGG